MLSSNPPIARSDLAKHQEISTGQSNQAGPGTSGFALSDFSCGFRFPLLNE